MIAKVTFVLGMALALLACGERLIESSYKSMLEAKQEGAIDHGWIPDYLPPSSRDIHELHRISNPVGWCSFQFSPSDSEALRKTLQTLGHRAPSYERIESPGKTWWPALLEGNLNMREVNVDGYELYVINKSEQDAMHRTFDYLFLIDWSKGAGFFYQTTRGSSH